MDKQIEETIKLVISRLAPKYTFGPYEVEDIEQQAWIIVLEKILDKWDGQRPLENFLMVSLSNRLKNFKRNNYYRLEDNNPTAEKKRQLMNKAEEYFDINEANDDFEEMFNKEEVAFYLNQLPTTLQNDFKRMANGVSIPTSRKQKVYKAIKDIYEKNRKTI